MGYAIKRIGYQTNVHRFTLNHHARSVDLCDSAADWSAVTCLPFGLHPQNMLSTYHNDLLLIDIANACDTSKQSDN